MDFSSFGNEIQKSSIFKHFWESNPKTLIIFATQTTNASDYEENTTQRLSEQIDLLER